jgi:hypothetical protein
VRQEADIAAAVIGEKLIKRDRQATPRSEPNPARLHFAGEEIEFVLVLFQPVHFELETGVSIKECSGLILSLGDGRPSEDAPDSALMEFGVGDKEFGLLGNTHRGTLPSCIGTSIIKKCLKEIDEEEKRTHQEKRRERGVSGFERDLSTGCIQPWNPRNIELAIARLGITLRQNDFAARPEISGLPDFDKGEFSDPAAVRLRFLIFDMFGFMPKADIYENVLIDVAHKNRFHPVCEYLKQQEAKWDGVARIDTWTIKYGGAEDNEFNRAVARIFLIAGVRRVRQQVSNMTPCSFSRLAREPRKARPSASWRGKTNGSPTICPWMPTAKSSSKGRAASGSLNPPTCPASAGERSTT